MNSFLSTARQLLFFLLGPSRDGHLFPRPAGVCGPSHFRRGRRKVMSRASWFAGAALACWIAASAASAAHAQRVTPPDRPAPPPPPTEKVTPPPAPAERTTTPPADTRTATR